jgi:hypothetical protein
MLSISLLTLAILQYGLCYSMESNKESIALDKQLMNAIKKGDRGKIEVIVRSGANVNQRKEGVSRGHSPLTLVVEQTINDIACGFDISNRLSILEILLEAGASIDERELQNNYTPLERTLTLRRTNLRMITFLLKHGALITEKFTKSAYSRGNSKIIKKLTRHKNLREKAIAQPTKELLNEAISNDNPFVVKLIARNAPELVETSHLELAKEKSAALLSILYKVLETVKKLEQFKKISEENEVPFELIRHIKKFVQHNI